VIFRGFDRGNLGSPSPQPSPIKGEGARGFVFDLSLPVLPNWKLAQLECTNFGSIESVMAQKRTDHSKFTRSNGTIQVLMLWASLALHLLLGSNLGLFGRLDPMKVKPVGGTVRVVDLTPAEQTRVPEAAKARPLPISPTPVNPEIATRILGSPSPPRSSGGAANFVPPRNRPQLSPPFRQPFNSPTVRQTSPPIPTPSTSKTSGKSDIPIFPRPPRLSQQDNEVTAGSNQGNSTIQGKPRKKGTQDSPLDSSSEDISPTPPVDSSPVEPDKEKPKPSNLLESSANSLVQLQKKLNQDIQNLKNSVGGNSSTIEKEISPTLNLPYSSITSVRSIKKCKLDQSGYVLFAIMRTKDNQLIPGKPQISSFLEEEGKILYSNVIDKAFKTIEDSPVDAEKNIIYKFRFEFSPNTCGK
jgi:hypothetical protein